MRKIVPGDWSFKLNHQEPNADLSLSRETIVAERPSSQKKALLQLQSAGSSN